MVKVEEKTDCYASEAQRKLLIEMSSFSMISEDFFLTGGTALSVFYMHHRKSEDIDLFTTNESIELSDIIFSIKKRWGQNLVEIKQTPEYFSGLIEGVKVDLVKDRLSDKSGRSRFAFNDRAKILIDSIENIMSNKLCTLVSRREPKDFIDFYFLSEYSDVFDFEKVYEGAVNKDAVFDDPPTAAYQIEDSYNAIREMVGGLSWMMKKIDTKLFDSFYKEIIKKIYDKK
ncbi:MAG: nucleotidyl transferase AbiEii/AbiGii toxin family protein [Fibrobacterota bacterium]